MPRFVVLRHECPGGRPRPSHWDLMLEFGGTLRTWAVAEEPAPGAVVAAERLADHRLDYLDYEGPVSGGRGTVRRWDLGTYEIVAEAEDRLDVDFQGEKLRGRATFRRSADTPTHGPTHWRIAL